MIKELLLTLLFLIIFTMVTIIKKKKSNIPYIKIIIAIIIPLITVFLVQVLFSFLQNETIVLIWDIISLILVCIINIVACCYIYKSITENPNKLIVIFKNNFKLWNIIALVIIIAGIALTITEHNLYAKYANDLYKTLETDVNILSFMTQTQSSQILLNRISLVRIILKSATVICMTIPVLLGKDNQHI